jgi:hypothetical protein
MLLRIEQLVYGTFPFWDRGYDVLARSSGLRDEWASEVIAACRRFGEAPSGVRPEPALFALRLPSGPWAIVGVGSPGLDDRGRPGALAFHALIVRDRDYRRIGSDPFAFAGALRREWSVGASLGALAWRSERRSGPTTSTDPRINRAVEALSRGRKVAVESPAPIDEFARSVWLGLPDSVRGQLSVATWAFGVENRFDLVALPRLAAVELDPSYLVDLTSDIPEPASRPNRLPIYYQAALVSVVAIGAGLAWREWNHPRPPDPPTSPASTAPEIPAPEVGEPVRARVLAGLLDLAERFEGFEAAGPDHPSELMARFSERVRYRGPTLSDGELARLKAEFDPDRDRALAWHERIKVYLDDHPLPGDFGRLPLPRQLDRLARSYHLEPPAEVESTPGFLAEALSRSGPIRPTPLAARYPALSDYARFLGRLPRLPTEIGR